MTTDVERLAEGWIEEQKTTPRRDEDAWAWGELQELTELEPDRAWDVIVRIHETDTTELIGKLLAAGPLEDLLVHHGQVVIDRLVIRARQDPSFRRLLNGIWQSDIEGSVWQRVQQIRGKAS